MAIKINQQNYWKFQATVNNLRKIENKCFICGSSENVGPHHINRTKYDSEQYYSKNNLILLCDDCHHRYHKQYPNVNQKTFCEFLRKELLKNHPNNGNKNKKNYQKNFNLKEELGMSKLKRILKLVNKTQTKRVKISVDGKMYDIYKISGDDNLTILELDSV